MLARITSNFLFLTETLSLGISTEPAPKPIDVCRADHSYAPPSEHSAACVSYSKSTYPSGAAAYFYFDFLGPQRIYGIPQVRDVVRTVSEVEGGTPKGTVKKIFVEGMLETLVDGRWSMTFKKPFVAFYGITARVLEDTPGGAVGLKPEPVCEADTNAIPRSKCETFKTCEDIKKRFTPEKSGFFYFHDSLGDHRIFAEPGYKGDECSFEGLLQTYMPGKKSWSPLVTLEVDENVTYRVFNPPAISKTAGMVAGYQTHVDRMRKRGIFART